MCNFILYICTYTYTQFICALITPLSPAKTPRSNCEADDLVQLPLSLKYDTLTNIHTDVCVL